MKLRPPLSPLAAPQAVLHCAAPDLRDAARVRSRDDALAALTAAYGAVLREFAGAKLGGLRMLPISGGVFAGKFAPELPALTCAALRGAFDALPARARHVVSVARLDMCIFDEKDEYAAYKEAFEDETRLAQEFADSLQMGSTPTQKWQT